MFVAVLALPLSLIYYILLLVGPLFARRWNVWVLNVVEVRLIASRHLCPVIPVQSVIKIAEARHFSATLVQIVLVLLVVEADVPLARGRAAGGAWPSRLALLGAS